MFSLDWVETTESCSHRKPQITEMGECPAQNLSDFQQPGLGGRPTDRSATRCPELRRVNDFSYSTIALKRLDGCD